MHINAWPVTIRWRGVELYQVSFNAMQKFTETRAANTPDELWLVQHPPVYTLGQAGDLAHLLALDTGIPLVKTDRGGQITFHGPGQVIAYLLLNLPRRQLMVREFVTHIEQAVIDTLADYQLPCERKPGSPGIYIQGERWHGAKISALGLKIRHGCSYHGVSLNVQMDLRPFNHINPCGYPGLKTVDMATLGVIADWHEVANRLAYYLLHPIDRTR